MRMRVVTLLTAILSATGLTACNDTAGPDSDIVVSGTIQNNTQAAIPANARLLVIWFVSSASPDYAYVHGEGTIDAAAGTFEVRLTPPPAEALNAGGLGVGLIVLTTNGTIAEGDDIGDLPDTDFVGAAGRYAVIYIAGEATDAAQFRAWAADFDTGFGVGVGLDGPGGAEPFAPTGASSVILIVDDINNIDFVDWT